MADNNNTVRPQESAANQGRASQQQPTKKTKVQYQGIYFTSEVDPEKSWLGPVLTPKTPNAFIDVTKDCTWALNQTEINNAGRPTVMITEHKLNMNSMIAQAISLARAGTGAVNAVFGSKANQLSNDPYVGLYSSTPTGFMYNLPLIGDEAIGWSSGASFDEPGEGGSFIDSFLKKAGDAIASASSLSQITNVDSESSIETIKKYKYTDTDDTFEFSFMLFNTENIADIQRHWELAFLLTYQNRQQRETTNLILPPHVYSYEIPGIRSSPACTLEKAEVEFLGQVRRYTIAGIDRTIPEAYRFKIRFKDLLQRGRNQHGYALNGSKITVFKDVREGLQ